MDQIIQAINDLASSGSMSELNTPVAVEERFSEVKKLLETIDFPENSETGDVLMALRDEALQNVIDGSGNAHTANAHAAFLIDQIKIYGPPNTSE